MRRNINDVLILVSIVLKSDTENTAIEIKAEEGIYVLVRRRRNEKVDFVLFEAEDGIQDLVQSRGLGDVYTRLIYVYIIYILYVCVCVCVVFYTHLTLPTKRIV